MAIDLRNLNDKQRAAVLHNEGPLTILSVAGSGKTRTLTTKIAYIVDELKVRPSRVWAVTFTNKAATEMQERLEDIIGDKADYVKMSTIHSMAYRIWRQGKRSKEPWWEAPKILTNEGPALSHLYKYLKDNNFVNKDASAYLALFGLYKLRRKTPEDIRKEIEANNGFPVDWHKPSRLNFHEAIYLVYKKYEAWKKSKNYIDFGDMLFNCINLLENPSYSNYVEKIQANCEYLLVDEAQDTNTIAFEILKIIGNKYKNITLVGDLRQSIYSFQGAEISNVKQFINQYKPHMINLNINYRSSKTIVENANEVIKYSQQVIGEPAETPNPIGEKITLYGNVTLQDEGVLMLDLVQNIKDQGYDWKDIAILYRIHSQSREIEDQFLLNKIPYVIFSKTPFYARKEIKDLLAYIKIALHPQDCEISEFKRIANRPVRYIPTYTLTKIDNIADNEEVVPAQVLDNIWDYDLEPKEINQMEKLMSDIHAIRKEIAKGKHTNEVFKFILETLGYKEWAIKAKKVKDVDDDVEMMFESLISSTEKFGTPQQFLDFIDFLKEEEKKKKDPNGNYIKMMSVHASKGKEFPVVILAGVCNRTYPFYKAVQEGNEEEERRVMYVALTRPKDKLYLSNLMGNYGRFNVGPSPYLGQMNVNLNQMENNVF